MEVPILTCFKLKALLKHRDKITRTVTPGECREIVWTRRHFTLKHKPYSEIGMDGEQMMCRSLVKVCRRRVCVGEVFGGWTRMLLAVQVVAVDLLKLSQLQTPLANFKFWH